ncbi:dynactin subunit 6-like [Artemia franciscana]|uniref:dynactin subunit 6-like n=1 Tax=Artemia franciscana TaxID=6661 RepID=UPI0032DA10FF
MTELLKIAPGAIVCKECDLVGDITIGTKTVIHPKAKILAEAGPIIIGDGNLIEEQTIIANRLKSETQDTLPVLVIGNNNVFEVDCHIEAAKIGDNNVIESKAYIGRNTRLSNGCVIGAKVRVTTYESIPENTVIYGSDCARRTLGEKPSAQAPQIEFLSKILPNYHHLRKIVKKTEEKSVK